METYLFFSVTKSQTGGTLHLLAQKLKNGAPISKLLSCSIMFAPLPVNKF